MPKVATHDMLMAALVASREHRGAESPAPLPHTYEMWAADFIYRAMLAAAPPPPAVRVTPQMVEAGLAAWQRTPGNQGNFMEAALIAALAVSFPIQQDEVSKMMVIKPDQLPPPHTLIEDRPGPIALMFYYTPGEVSFAQVANEHGYDVRWLSMEDDPTAAPLWQRYEDGEDVLADWQPTVPDGWLWGAKIDTEDGPGVVFIRPRKPIQQDADDIGQQEPGAGR